MDDQAESFEGTKLDKSSFTMEQRLNNAHQDTLESLEMLRGKLKAGGVLEESDHVKLHEPTSSRTPLESAVVNIEDHAQMIRELVHEIVL